VGSGSHLVAATYPGDTYYTSSSASQLLTVDPRPVTVTADPQTKQYGDTDPLLTYQLTLGNLVFNDAFSGELSRDVGEEAGQYAILQGTLALSANYTLTYVGDYLTITKAYPACTITPYDVTYDGTTYNATGVCLGVMDESLTGLDLTGTTHTDVGTYTDPWTFTDVTGNYNDANGTVNDKISLRNVTVVADAKTKTYGMPDPMLTYQLTVGTLLSGDTFSGELIRQPGNNIGTYAILQGTLSLPEYYEITYVGSDLTILGYIYFYPIIFSHNP
jgi:hypothetical protein